MKTLYIVVSIFLFGYPGLSQSFSFPTSGNATSPLVAADGVTLVSSISSIGCVPGGTSTFVYSTSHVSGGAIYRNTRWAAGCKNSTDIIKLDFSTVNTRPLGIKFSIYDVDNGADSVSVKIFSAGVPVDYSHQLFSPTYVTANGVSPAMGFHGSGNNNSGLDDNSGRIELSTISAMVRVDSILIYKHNNSDISGNPSQSFAGFDWSNSSSLPVKLLSFSASKSLDEIKLDWKVAQELGTREYHIEVADNTNNYVRIGNKIAAKGVMQGTTDYSVTVPSPSQAKVLYFRLACIGTEGTTYSKTITVRQNLVMKSEVYPSSFKNSFFLSVSSLHQTICHLKLISMDGKIVYKKKLSVATGNNLIPVNLVTDFPKGLYLVTGEMENDLSFRHRLIKE